MLWRFRFECNVLLLIHWSCLLMSNSWYLEVTNKISVLSLYPVVCPFLLSHAEAVTAPPCTGGEPFSFLALAPMQSLPFSWAITKETIPTTFTVYAHTEALCGLTIMCFNRNTLYNPYPIKPCGYQRSWACLGLGFCFLGFFVDGFLKA